MPALGPIKFPKVTFLNLNTKEHVTVDISRHETTLKSSKRTKGTGKMYRIETVKDGQKLSRIISEADYTMLNAKMGSSRGTSSGKAARRDTRSGKKMRSACSKKTRAACKRSKKTCTYVRKSKSGRNRSHCRSRRSKK